MPQVQAGVRFYKHNKNKKVMEAKNYLSEAQLRNVSDKFRGYFGISFSIFYDGLMSVLTKSIKIDIMRFDEWLHGQAGAYDEGDDARSMEEVITDLYGCDATSFIESLI